MEELSVRLKDCLEKSRKSYAKVIFVCIGTDRSTGDSYGPITGTLLEKEGFTVYGTLKKPIHAKNLENALTDIDTENNLVIALDASLGDAGNVGQIFIKSKPIRPGSAFGKTLPKVGDISITPIVGASGALDFMILQNTSLCRVVDFAEKTVEIIKEVFNNTDISEDLDNGEIYDRTTGETVVDISCATSSQINKLLEG